MKPPLLVTEAGIWKDSFPLVVFVMVVVGIDTLGSHPSNLSGALFFFLERRRHDPPRGFKVFYNRRYFLNFRRYLNKLG
jgi:hypothetical protein